jgi:hypothetical protein
MYAAYVDLSKAFDSVNREALWQLLELRGLSPALLARIKSLYRSCTASVQVKGHTSAPFPITTGVRQGCPMSPLLFNVFIDAVVRSVLRQHPQHGVRIAFSINGQLVEPAGRPTWSTALIPLLMYADDIVLLAPSMQQLTDMLNTLEAACADLGLKINHEKTKVQSVGCPQPTMPGHIATASGARLDVDTKFRYLGSMTASPPLNRMDTEISRRISSAAHSFHVVSRRVWSSPLIAPNTKIQLYNALVQAVLLYGNESWTLSRAQLARLETAHNRWIRRIKGVSMLDGLSNAELHEKGPQRTYPIRMWLYKFMLQWVGHLARREDSYLPKIMLFAHRIWCPATGRPVQRGVGRPPKSYLNAVHDLLTREPVETSKLAGVMMRAVDAAAAQERARNDEVDISRHPSWYDAAQVKSLWDTAVVSAMSHN